MTRIARPGGYRPGRVASLKHGQAQQFGVGVRVGRGWQVRVGVCVSRGGEVSKSLVTSFQLPSDN